MHLHQRFPNMEQMDLRIATILSSPGESGLSDHSKEDPVSYHRETRYHHHLAQEKAAFDDP